MSPGQTPGFSLRRISLPRVNCFLLYRSGKAMLVDCGTRHSERKILGEMRKMGLEPEMLELLLLTHVHYDHAGSAARLKELTGCRIMVHEADAPRLEAGRTPFPGGTRWKARLVVGLGKVLARRTMYFQAVGADILAGEIADLGELGFEGSAIHVPGHTPGSMVVLLPGGDLLGGDSFFGLAGKRHFPPFAEDEESLRESWARLSGMEFRTIHPAHGHAFSKENYLEELADG